MTTRVLMQVIHDRTMAMNNSFVPALKRMAEGMKRGKLQCVTMAEHTRCFWWDGNNTPFRPSKLVRIVLADGYFVLIGDDGGYTDRSVKIGGSAQQGAQVVFPLNLSGVADANYLSTVLTEKHCVSLITPHCLCCMSVRSVQGYRFCAYCKDPSHLSNHYFPHGGYISACCIDHANQHDCCIPCTELSDEYGTHLMCLNGNFSTINTCDFDHLPCLPMDVVVKISEYLFVPCFGSEFLEAWNDVSRNGTLLSIRVNFEIHSVYKSMNAAEFNLSKSRSTDPFGNPDYFYMPSFYVDNEDEDSIVNPDPFIPPDGVPVTGGTNVVFLNNDSMFPNGVRVSNDQGMPVSINLEVSAVELDAVGGAEDMDEISI